MSSEKLFFLGGRGGGGCGRSFLCFHPRRPSPGMEKGRFLSQHQLRGVSPGKKVGKVTERKRRRRKNMAKKSGKLFTLSADFVEEIKWLRLHILTQKKY